MYSNASQGFATCRVPTPARNDFEKARAMLLRPPSARGRDSEVRSARHSKAKWRRRDTCCREDKLISSDESEAPRQSTPCTARSSSRRGCAYRPKEEAEALLELLAHLDPSLLHGGDDALPVRGARNVNLQRVHGSAMSGAWLGATVDASGRK
eukprot:3698792-Pleurochrysis_carterae.AAC.1